MQPFALILQNLAPAPYIPPNFKDFIGTYEMFNTTYIVCNRGEEKREEKGEKKGEEGEEGEKAREVRGGERGGR